VPVGTPVRIVNQPRLLGWHEGNLYLEAHPALEDDRRNLDAALEKQLAAALRRRAAPAGPGPAVKVDRTLVAATTKEGRGIPVRLLESAADAASMAARARPTRNIVTYPVERDAAAPTTPDLDAANR
jgi:L,D-transpeptidase ErfK/SrfK